MEIFLDSLDVNEIRKYSELNVLAGVTTNPTMARRFDMKSDIEMVTRVRKALGDGEIHVEAFGDTADEIVEHARKTLKETQDDDLVFKIPFGLQGIGACRKLARDNIKTSLHLIFSVNQALLAASAKSTYICPLVGRADDIGHDAMKNLKDMVDAFRVNSESTKIMVSSVRHPQHVKGAYMCGVDAITIPVNVMSQIFEHPLTISGTRIFRGDIEAAKPVSSRRIDPNLIADKNDTIQRCLSLMVMHKAGAVAISSNDRLAGIFTAGDLKRLVEGKIQFDMDDRIAKFMTKKPITIGVNESTAKARELIKKFNVNQLVVVDDGNVVGILDSKAL